MTLLLLLVCAAVSWRLLPVLARLSSDAVLARRSKGRLVLTYDDGPSPALTPDILSMLSQTGARATFFMPGEQIEANRTLAQDVIAAGHEVGSHSQTHLHARRVPSRQSLADMVAGAKTVSELAGDAPLYRPPYGKITAAQVIKAFWTRTRLAWWTIDTRDTEESWLGIEEVLAQIKRDGGGVVLMHDAAGTRPDDHRHYVLTLSRALIALARDEGWDVVRFSELWPARAQPKPQRLKVTKPS